MCYNQVVGENTPDPATFSAWREMIRKAYHPDEHGFRDVGGAGVGVCKPWRDSYKNFLRDMGPHPPGTTLRRRDSSKAFNPNNCYWG